MAKKHPVDDAIARMSRRDQRVADQLAEAGETDEDLYAALPSPGVERLLRNEPPKKRARRAVPMDAQRLREREAAHGLKGLGDGR